MKWWLECMRKYVDFRGRARRREFWMFTLFNALGGALLIVCGAAAALLVGRSWDEGTDGVAVALTVCGFALLLYIWLLATFLPGLAVRVRRLHDIGLSGKWLLGYYAFDMVCMHWLVVSVLRFFEEAASEEILAWSTAAALWIIVRPTVAALAVLTAAGVAVMCVGSDKGANRYGGDPRASVSDTCH